MKKIILFLLGISSVFFSAFPAIPGGIVNQQSYSIEYQRTFCRNAATDAADAVVFNPAGVMKLANGIYTNGGVYYTRKDYSNTISGIKYSTDVPSFIPGFFAVYKKQKCAAFAAFTAPAGGGEVEYDNGNATTFALGQGFIAGANAQLEVLDVPSQYWYNSINSQSLDANSYYFGYSIGGAYQFTDVVSVALGTRYLDAHKKARGQVTIGSSAPSITPDKTAILDFTEKANGWAGFAGVNITPSVKWNVGIRYVTSTKLDFETEVQEDSLRMKMDGAKQREDLPGLIGLGVSYSISPKIKIDGNLTYYLEKNATWETDRLQNAGDSFDLAFALEYRFNPKLKGSVGHMYFDKDIVPDDMKPESPELGGHILCGGIQYEATSRLSLNFAMNTSFYNKERTSTDVTYNKSITGFGFGFQYKIK